MAAGRHLSLVAVAAAAALVGLLSTGPARAAMDCQGSLPLPDDLELIAPGAEVPEAFAAFSGVWSGGWSEPTGQEVLCAALAVEQVTRNGQVAVLYAFASHGPWNIMTPGFFRATGRIQDGELRFVSGRGGGFAFRQNEVGLVGRYNGEGRIEASRVDDPDTLRCGPYGTEAEPLVGNTRDRLADAELTIVARPAGPVANSYFAPMGDHGPPLHSFNGTLILSPSPTQVGVSGCRGVSALDSGGRFDFVSVGDRLVPVQRGVIRRIGRGAVDLILSPGRIWSEPVDNGLTRAAFPFVSVDRSSNETHNGIATFLFNEDTVSPLRWQVVQETASWARRDSWGQMTSDYLPGTVENAVEVEAAFRAEQADALPVKSWETLKKDNPSVALDHFTGAWGQEHISATGVVLDGEIYLQPCRTRFGDYPFCREMRHGVYSVTKSAGAALALLRLAQKYGPEVLDYKIEDYVEVTAGHEGWTDVTFANALSMAVGVGDKTPEREPLQISAQEGGPTFFNWMSASGAAEKLRLAFQLPDYPWDPGEVVRYHTPHTFILAAAMDALVKQREGAEHNLWDLVAEEVLRPIGVHHLPTMHTIESDGGRGVPILGYGLYPTVDDIAKIAILMQNGGRHGERQILHGGALKEALFRGSQQGLVTGNRNRYGDQRYYQSFWSLPFRSISGCLHQVPYMSGYGGNMVVLQPSGVTAFRFADSHNFNIDSMLEVSDRLRPYCRPGASKTAEAEHQRMTAKDLREALSGNTLYGHLWHAYLDPDGNMVTAYGEEKDLARWRVTDEGLLCTRYHRWRGRTEFCESASRDGDLYRLFSDSGVGYAEFRLETGNVENF